ncbi:MAG TPA: cysteine desulfurase family protein [Limnochordales bacterium]
MTSGRAGNWAGGLIYLDYAASAPLLPQAAQAMRELLCPGESPANPASVHRAGRQARRLLEAARETVAEHLGADPAEIVFTSGGTEADNLALRGAAWAMLRQQGRAGVVVSAIEHHAILEAARHLAREGFRVELACCDGCGVVTAEAVEQAIGRLAADGVRVGVVALMAVNNEVGTVQPVQAAAAVAHRHGALFLVDGVQAAEADWLAVQRVGCDLLTLSAHKFGGPQGVGALYVRRGVPFEPILFGGAQERELRPGTPNLVGVVGMAEALRWTREHRQELARRRRELDGRLVAGLQEAVEGLQLNGGGAERWPGLVNVWVPGVSAETLLVELDLEGVACSAGPACTAGSLVPSHVLQAMGLERERVEGSVRLSLGWATTADEVEEAVVRFGRAVQRLRRRRQDRRAREAVRT